jgi:DNA-binding XRE family transcriptional regulator
MSTMAKSPKSDKNAAIARRAIARNEETLTEAEMDELLAARTPLAFWRRKRRLTQAQLAKTTGIAQGFLSEIEAGHKTGAVDALRRIASALRVSLDDIASTQDRAAIIVQQRKPPARKINIRRSAKR